MSLAQIRDSALDTTEEIANALDWADLRLSVQILFQGLAHHFRALSLQAFGRSLQLGGQIGW
jgi:hypothetical protein